MFVVIIIIIIITDITDIVKILIHYVFLHHTSRISNVRNVIFLIVDFQTIFMHNVEHAYHNLVTSMWF